MSHARPPRGATASLFALGLVLVLGPDPAGQAAPPGPPLARYVPAKDLVLFIEFDGLDAHADAWRKTATYALLNGTKLGPMLADLGMQVLDEVIASAPAGAMPKASDIVDLLRLAARDGFALGVMAGGREGGPPSVLVLNNGARNGTPEILGRFPGKWREIRRGPRTLHMAGEGDAASGWWVEGDDLLIAGPRAADSDAILDAIDGKSPSAAGSPVVAELRRADTGFEPLLIAFLDFANVPTPPEAARLGLDGLKRIDLRWGFQDRALFSVVRVVAPAPRKGLLALLDGPTFRLGQVPAIPTGVENFTVFAADPDVIYDKVVALLKQGDPGAEARIAAAEKAVAEALGARLKEDILGRLGPFWVGYLGNEANGPRGALVTEVREPDRFLEVLDRVAQIANAQIRAEAARRPRAGQAPAEIRKIDGPTPGYQLVLPPGAVAPQAAAFASPTILVGKGRIALGVNEDEARAALDTRAWTPGPEVAGPLGRTPKDLLMLNLDDPRTTVPALVEATPLLLLGANNFLATIHQARLAAARAAARNGGRPIPPARPPLALKIDAEKVPTAEAVAAPLFPGFSTVSVGDDGLTYIARDSIPTINPVVASGVMVALLLPAVQAAREAARRAQCTNNMKQIGLALHSYFQTADVLPPPAIRGKDGKPLLSWRVAILPYIEQQALYNEFHRDEPWDSPHNKALIPRMPGVYLCPSRARPEPGTTTYKAIVGPGSAFDPAAPVRIADFRDGTSNTLAVVESKTPVIWTRPDDIPFDPKAPPSLLDAGSPHPGGFTALIMDGSVRFLKMTLDPKVFRKLITRDGGESIEPGSY